MEKFTARIGNNLTQILKKEFNFSFFDANLFSKIHTLYV